jgi:hypothetical protein
MASIDVFGAAVGILIYLCGQRGAGIFLITFFVVLGAASQFLLPWWIARAMYRRNPRQFAERTVSLNDMGLTADSKVAHTEIKWENFEKVRETENLFLLYQTKDCVGVIPKRAMPNEQELAKLRSFLHSKVSS